MPRFKKITSNEDGWSDWQNPIMKGYRHGCCDCGLVHTMEFDVRKVLKNLPSGEYISEPTKAGQYQVFFRVKRNNRSTVRIRKTPHKFKQ